MDQLHYKEMTRNLDALVHSGELENRKIYLFGHCNATEELADSLLERGYFPRAILDNSPAKHGNTYREIRIIPPEGILADDQEQTFVCIAARAYAAMADQLRRMGYRGTARKVVDYNSYADYSLSRDTLERMGQRAERGRQRLHRLEQDWPGYLKVLCPFAALGDIYYMMSYLPHYLEKTGRTGCVTGVIGRGCAGVAGLFGKYPVEVFSQQEMDETIQAALCTGSRNVFVAHQDRPYVVDLHRALHVKLVPLEQIYCCGVFGLPPDTEPCIPEAFTRYPGLEGIEEGNAVVLSPHAKSVTSLPDSLWEQIAESYRRAGFQCFTNVAGEEKPVKGTVPISPSLAEIRSVVERAGRFIGIRSGLCDVLRTARAQKTALYSDYSYCDTRWKAVDMYRLDGWENIVVKDGFVWKMK